jgi:heme/copper-type cytochrome/quinol oxidase subunit 3
MSHAPAADASALAPIDALGQTEYVRRTFGYSPGKLAMWLFLASDAMGFVGLISTYIVLRYGYVGTEWIPSTGAFGASNDAGPMEGLPHLAPILTGINTFILIVSSFTMVLALNAISHGNKKGLVTWLFATILCGATFLGIQVYEYQHLIHTGLVMSAHPYASTFYITTGFHGAHVLSGVIYLTCIWIGALRGKYTQDNHSPVELVGLFWHFVDLVWIVLFTIIYLF